MVNNQIPELSHSLEMNFYKSHFVTERESWNLEDMKRFEAIRR